MPSSSPSRKHLKSTIFTAGFAVSAALAGMVPLHASQPVKVTLIGLNDLHGNIEEKTVAVGTAPAIRSVKVGGAALMGAYMRIAREDNPRTLVLDAGDAYQGTLLSNHFEGRPVVEAYNAIGVDASTFGNHEFDFGDLNGKPQGAPFDPQGAMRELLGHTRFSYLSANVEAAKAFPGVKPSKIFELDGVKVGVIGVTTESTPKEAAPANVAGLVFKSVAATVLEQSRKLRAEGAQLVVVLAHAGGRCDMSKPPHQGDEACKADKPDEITAMLDAVPSGTVDAVFAGHVHAGQAHFIRGVPVVQTFGFGNSFSRVDLWVTPGGVSRAEISKPVYFCHTHFENYPSCSPEELKTGGQYPSDFGNAVPATYLGRAVAPESAPAGVLAPFQEQVRALIEKFIVELPGGLAHDRTAESPVSNCVADAVHEQIEHETGRKADLFVTHSGGIRAPLPKSVRFGDVFTVLPFDSSMAVVTLTGEELEGFGRYQSETPKSIAVLSDRDWRVKLARKPVFPRHRGFVTPSGHAPEAGEKYVILTDEFNVAPGGATDALLRKARQEGRIELLGRLSRDLFADRLSRGGRLPESCLGGELNRTIFVDEQ